uniref:THAP domain-containing protein 1 n=1 Tax=Neogobius melanostomus TaxID=47308 RepID=A0A8C6S6J8_9GOBI
MPSRCVAGFCSNTHKDGVSLFKFPKEPELHLKWVKQVRRTREQWTPSSSSSLLCSEHFELDCFDSAPVVKESLGCSVQHKRVLLRTAVPTVFRRGVRASGAAGLSNTDSVIEPTVRVSVATPTSSTSVPVRSCVHKRQKIQVHKQTQTRTVSVAVKPRSKTKGKSWGLFMKVHYYWINIVIFYFVQFMFSITLFYLHFHLYCFINFVLFFV